MIKVVVRSWKVKALVIADNARLEVFNNGRFEHGVTPTLEEATSDNFYSDWEAYINDMEALPDWMIEHLEIKILRPLTFMEKRVVSSGDIVKAIGTQQVHLPGNELLKVKNVKNLDDCCTDELNLALKDGWNILAVCPQPNQRRPDYILGRGYL